MVAKNKSGRKKGALHYLTRRSHLKIESQKAVPLKNENPPVWEAWGSDLGFDDEVLESSLEGRGLSPWFPGSDGDL